MEEVTANEEKQLTDDMSVKFGTGVVRYEDADRVIKGLTSIGNLDIDDFIMNFNIANAISKLEKVNKAYLKSMASLQKKNIATAENGNFKVENGFYVFKSPDIKDAHEKASEELTNKTVDLKMRLKTSFLKPLKNCKGPMMFQIHELIEIDDSGLVKE